MRDDSGVSLLSYALAAAALAGIVMLAFYVSHGYSRHDMETKAERVAVEVLERSHSISEQIEVALATLESSVLKAAPCSPQSLALMQTLALSATYLQEIGYIHDDRLVCTSHGLLGHGSGYALGLRDYTSRTGYDIRASVRLPFAGKAPFLIATHQGTGFSALVIPDLALDFLQNEADISIGLFGLHSNKVILQRGSVDPAWFESPFDEDGLARASDAQRLVVIKRSPRFEYAAYVAIPLARLGPESLKLDLIMLPLALLAGLAVAGLIVLLAKRQNALPYLLRHAVQHNELFMVYQPIVAIATGEWIGAEALVRWRRSDGTLVGPDVFIPLAEQSDLICDVTAKVMELVTRDAVELLQVCPRFHLSINFSARDLGDPRLLDKLGAALGPGLVASGNLVVEVTERVLVHFEDVSRNICAMRDMGIKLAIDDFGTGYAGLSYLTALELDYLKIDKLFIDTIGTDAATSQVVAHIIEIAKSLKLEMIAEGVETQAHADYLAQRGVQFAQGWLYSRPLALSALMAGLKEASLP